MKCTLLLVDESADSACAVKHVIDLHRTQPLNVMLLSVQAPLSSYVSRFLKAEDVQDFHRENGRRTLQPHADRLRTAGVPYTEHITVGQKAACIARFAQDHHCEQIVLPKAKGMLDSLGLGSIGSQLRHMIGANGVCEISEVY